MLAIKRKNKIKETLKMKKSISVHELSKLLTVTEETVRKDLQTLEKEGFLKRAYGGAYLNDSKNLSDLFDMSLEATLKDETNKFVKYMFECIEDNDVIYLDDSNISFEFIAKCPKKCKVFTNSFNIATLGITNSNISIYLFGGNLNNQIITVDDLEVIDRYNFSKCFITDCFVDKTNNIYVESNSFFKQKIFKRSKIVICINENNIIKNDYLCSVENITVVVTDNNDFENQNGRFAII